MDARRTKTVSKFMSLVLRHEPETIGLRLDPAGWAGVDELLDGMANHGQRVTRDELAHVVATSDKQRFVLSDDGSRIRANQGHSVAVDLGYPPQRPPDVLYHGTAAQFATSIRTKGLERMARHAVHLSGSAEQTLRVAQRKGKPVLVTIDAKRMHADGYAFARSPNGVWLTDHVPPQYLSVGGGSEGEEHSRGAGWSDSVESKQSDDP